MVPKDSAEFSGESTDVGRGDPGLDGFLVFIRALSVSSGGGMFSEGPLGVPTGY